MKHVAALASFRFWGELRNKPYCVILEHFCHKLHGFDRMHHVTSSLLPIVYIIIKDTDQYSIKVFNHNLKVDTDSDSVFTSI